MEINTDVKGIVELNILLSFLVKSLREKSPPQLTRKQFEEYVGYPRQPNHATYVIDKLIKKKIFVPVGYVKNESQRDSAVYNIDKILLKDYITHTETFVKMFIVTWLSATSFVPDTVFYNSNDFNDIVHVRKYD